jgi:hypothetical protein
MKDWSPPRANGDYRKVASLSTQIITWLPATGWWLHSVRAASRLHRGRTIAERNPAAANPLFHIKYKEHESREFIFIFI